MAETLAQQKEAVVAAMATLHEEVTALTTGTDWAAWLSFMSKLHGYSMRNRFWMWAQWEQRQRFQALMSFCTMGAIPALPDFSMPAAFSFWKSHGRMVKKGEKALTVLAPIMVPDRERPPVNGKPATKCIGFRLSSRTFDIAQTHGADVPTNPVTVKLLEGEGDVATMAALRTVAKLNGCEVSDTMPTMTPDAANGCYVFSTKTIHLHPARSGEQRVKTMVHELAHSMLHTPEQYTMAHSGAVNVAEVEAESVAYVVTSALGMDSSAYSLPYVVSWSNGDGELLTNTAERVLDCAERILEAMQTGKLPRSRVSKAAEVERVVQQAL